MPPYPSEERGSDWYPDPLRAGRYRWFDGTNWTNAVLDRPPMSPPASDGEASPQDTPLALADSNGAVGRVVAGQAPEATGVPNQYETPYRHAEAVSSPAAIDEDTTDPMQTSDKSGTDVSAGTNQATHSDMRPADIEKLGESDANSPDKVRLGSPPWSVDPPAQPTTPASLVSDNEPSSDSARKVVLTAVAALALAVVVSVIAVSSTDTGGSSTDSLDSGTDIANTTAADFEQAVKALKIAVPELGLMSNTDLRTTATSICSALAEGETRIDIQYDLISRFYYPAEEANLLIDFSVQARCPQFD